jgi:hypothetical protein
MTYRPARTLGVGRKLVWIGASCAVFLIGQKQRRVDSLGLRGAPDTHAAKRTFSGSGTSSPLSIISADT